MTEIIDKILQENYFQENYFSIHQVDFLKKMQNDISLFYKLVTEADDSFWHDETVPQEHS